jgi:ABC-type amino acid transport substrate-binding protein
MVRSTLYGAGALLALTLAVASCAPPPTPPPPPAPPGPRPLLVGVNSASPPYAFRQQDGVLVGMEVDFARELGRALGRPVRIGDLRFEELFPALADGRIDIAMSGLTITRLREVRVAFSDPYLRSGLLAMIQRQNVERYPTLASVFACNARFSVVNGTTGEKFIRDRCGATGLIYPTNSTEIAIAEVKAGRSDIMIQDAPIVVWAVSGNEGVLALIRDPLDREDLGWAVRREDPGMLAQVNAVLEQWDGDGTRAAVLDRWVPYWRTLEAKTSRLR